MKTILLRLLLAVNILASTAMLFTAYCGLINPSKHAYMSALSILFPYTILPVAAFLLLWLAVHRRYALLPLFTIVLCAPPLRATIPFNIRSEAPADAIKVMSYNAYLFDKWDYPDITDNAIIAYLCDADADIVCVQEAVFEERDSAIFMQKLKQTYTYHHIRRENHGGTQLLLLSKHPILRSEKIEYPSHANMSMAYELLIDGDTMLVVNNHFETNAISDADRSRMESITGNSEEAYSGKLRTARRLLRKLAYATWVRARQARAVAEYIQQNKRKHIIVCGDFNDHPLSYTVRTVQKGLTNCFAATGNGTGYTYKHNSINVRIDHIMCSKQLQPYNCHIDTGIECSDHYPVICYMKKRHP